MGEQLRFIFRYIQREHFLGNVQYPETSPWVFHCILDIEHTSCKFNNIYFFNFFPTLSHHRLKQNNTTCCHFTQKRCFHSALSWRLSGSLAKGPLSAFKRGYFFNYFSFAPKVTELSDKWRNDIVYWNVKKEHIESILPPQKNYLSFCKIHEQPQNLYSLGL